MKSNIEMSMNVFTALGFSDAEERQTKIGLAVLINRIIEKRELRQIEVSMVLSIAQPRVSSLRNYKLDHFSVERLLEFLTMLGQNVEIRVSPAKSRKKAEIRVAFAE